MSTPVPPTYERISGDRVEQGQRIRAKGEWYLILSPGESVDHGGHATRVMNARREESGLEMTITLFSGRFYSYEKAKVSQ